MVGEGTGGRGGGATGTGGPGRELRHVRRKRRRRTVGNRHPLRSSLEDNSTCVAKRE